MQTTKLLTEFVGTFFLVTVVAFTGNPLAIGAVLMLLVYSGGHISGGHFNPAVTFGFYLKKKMLLNESLSYICVQFAGALVAGIFYMSTHQVFFAPQPAVSTSWLTAFIVEALFTFLLVRTILMVAADPHVKGNQYFGLAIGAALFIGATAGGPISGGAFNPAVGVAPWLVNMNEFMTHLPIVLLYILGPLVGAGVAAKIDGLGK